MKIRKRGRTVGREPGKVKRKADKGREVKERWEGAREGEEGKKEG